MKEIMLLVTYKLKPQAREYFLGEVAAAEILQKTCREDGALRYDYYLSAADADAVLLVERWRSAEAQSAHLQTAHIAELKRIKEKYVLETVVEKFEM
ncbi:putative quinol monooxygenase [Ruminococcus sp. 210702-SL.1.03]|uniref:putative quinol monooxygenase n=1 Tax=Ruminococcus sp. 210702-SL.1.03 TaxID=2883233 RepID=UPI001D05C4C4|nr:antibiotic biosynthesis monooxygenase family protein [Ruminococcus sp. 210702-SL.1.03]MCB6615795.1 antibiotic biosynthesis monooxygenase [Ruminococcus sp. 210702-SL.1.03]